jgi:putative hydrolase of the HAD superfamily
MRTGPDIEVVLFDIGGVLVTEEPLHWMPRWETRLGMAPGALMAALTPIWQAGSVGAIGLPEVHARLRPIVHDSEAFMEDVWSTYLGQPRTPVLAQFQTLGPRRALLSNSFVGAREREAERYGFDSMVERIVYSHEVGMQKPEPRIYAHTCDLLSVSPEQVFFVDDRAENVDAARALGMHAILAGPDDGETVRAIERGLVR